MEIIGYLASFIMGISLGLMGGGGSILTVPILVYLFQMHPLDATTSSLFIVGSVSLITAVRYGLRNELDFKIALLFSFPSLIGIYFARNVVLPGIPESIALTNAFQIEKGTLVLVAFSILMIAASVSMILQKKENLEKKNRSKIFIGAQGVATGFVTGFVGAGGGFMILPVLVKLLHLPMRIAIGTSLAIIAINTLFGFSVSLLKSPNIDWKLQFIVLAIALVGSFFGLKMSSRIDEKKLKKVFGWFVLIVGLVILIERIR